MSRWDFDFFFFPSCCFMRPFILKCRVPVTLEPPDPVRPRWSAATMPTVSVKRDLLFEALGQKYSKCSTCLCFLKASAFTSVLLAGKCAQRVCDWLIVSASGETMRNILIKQITFYILVHLIITERIHFETQNKFKIHFPVCRSDCIRFKLFRDFTEFIEDFVLYLICNFLVWCCLNTVMLYGL